MNEDSPLRFLLAMAAVLAAMVAVTPFLSPPGTLVALDGSAGYVDHWSIWMSLDPLSGLTYLMGDVFCHQAESRSFHLNGNQLAVCIRDTGVLLGLGAGLALVLRSDRLRAARARLLVPGILLMLPLFADWTLQHMAGADLWPSRLVTGVLFGIGAAMIARDLFDRVFLEAADER